MARPQAQPQQKREGVLSGSRTLWPPAPRASGSMDFPVLKCLIINKKMSKAAVYFVLPDCPPGTQVFRGERNERPRRQGLCPLGRSLGTLALRHPGSTAPWLQELGQVSHPSPASSPETGGDASRAVSGCCTFREMRVGSPQHSVLDTKDQNMMGDQGL